MTFALKEPPIIQEGRPRHGMFALTFSGKQFWPADPRLGDVDLVDIAHHLSMQCRFGGATHSFYSVAQHSVIVAKLCSPENRLVALLHDATEAYLQDIIKPLKIEVGHRYRMLERAWAEVIDLEFGLRGKLVDLPQEVHDADRTALVAERRILMHPTERWRTEIDIRAEAITIDPWMPDRACARFLRAFRLYSGDAS